MHRRLYDNQPGISARGKCYGHGLPAWESRLELDLCCGADLFVRSGAKKLVQCVQQRPNRSPLSEVGKDPGPLLALK